MIDKIFEEQILNDIRIDAFKIGIRFINYEMVPGDICEFGCYTGRSLAALTYCHQKYFKDENKHNRKGTISRKIFGFDSFEGLTESENHQDGIKGYSTKTIPFILQLTMEKMSPLIKYLIFSININYNNQ